jgi:hypothetical protein
VSWFTHLAPEAQAAVIAGAVAALTALITAISTATNVLLQARLDRRAAAAEQRGLRRELYRNYADPLTSAPRLFTGDSARSSKMAEADTSRLVEARPGSRRTKPAALATASPACSGG